MAKHSFCHQMLKDVLDDVRQHFTEEEISKAWVIGSNGRYEFHGPNNFFSYLKADCVASAKADGWCKLLDAKEESEAIASADSERNSDAAV